jgi:D-alanyl-lipoteichoic acid acyltransferase DltB (MBOAT superfamily)
MPFLSIEFVVFIGVVVPVVFVVPNRFRTPYLLIANYVFYILNAGSYVLLLLLLTLVTFAVGRALEHSTSANRRRALLILCVTAYLSIFLLARQRESSVLGLSFYTFTGISYVVDIFQRRIESTSKLIPFAATLSFFPNVTAGPIEKVDHLLPQLNNVGWPRGHRLTEGLRLILWGGFKKFVIANRLAVLVDRAYANPRDFGGGDLLLATLFFSFQIYADFSGYTDIAIGFARLLGVDLFENFRRPYLSRSVLVFWRHWHMSLTNWVRAYAYMPYSRFLLRRVGRNHARLIEMSGYLLVMFLVGAWHGSRLTFVVWGLLNGAYMVVEAALPARARRRPPRTNFALIAHIVVTFGLITFSWIFFRADTIGDGVFIVRRIFGSTGFKGLLDPEIFGVYDLVISVIGIAVLIAVDVVEEVVASGSAVIRFDRLPVWLRWPVYYGLTVVTLMFGKFGLEQFIYARF